MTKKNNLIIASFFGFLFACGDTEFTSNDGNQQIASSNEPIVMNYTIPNMYPHDTSAFTEGLEWHNGLLLESTGYETERGVTKLAFVDLKTGIEKQKITLGRKYFGEGATLLNGKIYQLTYTEQKCFVYDAATLKKIHEFTYEGEGWGLTNNGKQLIMSNGSDKIYFRNPSTFKVLSILSVTDNNGPLGKINELEYVNGSIYANIWTTYKIVKINSESGKVEKQADFSGIKEKYFPELSQPTQTDVLNGIAYDSVGKRFYITGKFWPKVFEVNMN
jgi:glutaminyl-peptide cyclotransferase